MKSLRRILLTLSLTAAMTVPAFTGSGTSEPVKVATAAPAKTSKRMTFRHESNRSSAKARQRGDVGLDPTAGSDRTIVRESRTGSISSFLSSEKELLRKSNLKFKGKTRKASSKVNAGVARQLENFNPDALSFMDEPTPAPKKERKKHRSKKK